MFCQPGFEFFKQQLKTTQHNYLEIGVFNGDSVAQLAREYPMLKIYGIDPFIEDGCTTDHTGVKENQFMPGQYANTQANTAGLDNITLFEMTSEQFSNELTDRQIADMDVAYVLIDGSHHYRDVAIDVDLAMRLIGNRKGAVVFDDVNIAGVAQAHEEFLEKYRSQIGQAWDLFGQHPGHILAYSING